MDLLFKVKKCMIEKELVEPGDHLLVAVSGGIDSMTLLSSLLQLQNELGFLISVVHINHKLRGAESDTDEKFVANFCKERSIPFFVAEWEGPARGINLQEAARNFRYSKFIELAEKIKATSVAVAHNLDDQAETVLLNLIRGAGLDGICGMEQKKLLFEKIQLIRPFLEISRIEIEAHQKKDEVGYREDVTNDQLKYTRNIIRHKIMPLLQEINPNAPVSISKMTHLLQKDESYIQAIAEGIFGNSCKEGQGSVQIDETIFQELAPSIRSRILKLAYSKVKGSIAGISRDHLEKMDLITFSTKREGEYSLPDGLKFTRKNGHLKISKD
jgi:tRNA(Ile)-lysidine synthase